MTETGRPRRGRYFIHDGSRILGDLFDPAFQSNESRTSFRYLRTRYYRRVLAAVDGMLTREDLVFYVSYTLEGGLPALPEYGPHVVSILVTEERTRVPVYAQQIAAVFKTQGRYPRHFLTPPGFFEYPSYTSMLTRVQYARALVLNRWALFRGNVGTWDQEKEAEQPYYDIPLGYAAQLDLPVKPINKRTIDVFFGGSLVHVVRPFWHVKSWVKPPKRVFRERMFKAMQQLSVQHPALKVVWGVNDSYEDSQQFKDEDAYSSRMQDARVCLVPRGATPDTCRFFEALRFGCVVVCDGLPDTRYYRDAPVIQLRDWKELDVVLPALLADQQRLQQMHEATLRWWHEKCAEAVIARYIVDKVESVPA